MTPETIERFRSFARLRDFRVPDEPEKTFAALVSVAKWAILQRSAPHASHDALLNPANEFTNLWMGLLLQLATVDRAFFDLAKRMAARTLVRPEPPALLYRQMAAMLLFAESGPTTRKTAAARDAAIVLAIATCIEAGLTPTESHESQHAPRSGCAKVAIALGLEYGAIEKVWRNRIDRLVDVGFPAAEVSDFFARSSPTTEMG